MARPVASDFLHAMRFHVVVSNAGGGESRFLQRSNIEDGKVDAGFSNMSTPSVTVELAEYREGHYIYTRKYPGIPSMDDVVMSRGVALVDTDFWDWLRVVIEGRGEYRADLTIFHHHRSADEITPALNREFSPQGEDNIRKQNQILDLNANARRYELYEAFPTTHKVASDLDGTSSEIGVMELGISYERFEVIPVQVDTAAVQS